MDLMDLFISSARAEEAKTPYISVGFEPRFHKISENGWIAFGVVVLFVAVMLVVILTNKKKKWTARMLTNGAIAISLSFVLSFIRLARMGNGGSVTLASMLPLMLFSAVYGVGPGMITGVVYGILQYIQDPQVVHWAQMLMDYPIAFAMLGLAGFYKPFADKKKDWFLFLSIFIAAFGRFVCHTFAGIFWYGDGDSASWSFMFKLWTSALYNGNYMLWDTLICLIVAVPVYRPVMKIMKG
ncbi:MAG: energy-coupled thiamine transporter ThiT [Clostridia bacterium]|nr:energy-coupled thiamine transporter ThiT [Clostridia bacterium]